MKPDDTIKKIEEEVGIHCRERDQAEPRETSDNLGNRCLEWQTALILEVKGTKEAEEGNVFRQTIPVQFDISFDGDRRKIYFFLQWGRIESDLWNLSEPAIRKRFVEQPDVRIRFAEDREVAELGVIYPLQEFAFGYVYEEIVSYFGLINGIMIEKANGAK